MHQTARQAVTVTLRAVPQLRKLTRDAGSARDRLGIHARLGMRRTALAALIARTRQLLEDLDIFFAMIDGTMARTYARRIVNLRRVGAHLCITPRMPIMAPTSAHSSYGPGAAAGTAA